MVKPPGLSVHVSQLLNGKEVEMLDQEAVCKSQNVFPVGSAPIETLIELEVQSGYR